MAPHCRRCTGLTGHPWVPALITVATLVGCGGSAGGDNSKILMDYASMSGGVVFATRAIQGSNGYDLFWAPVPNGQTVDKMPWIRLTDAGGHEWQPSVSRGGQGLVYTKPEDGIFLVSISGRITRVTDVGGTALKDSLPSISHDGDRIAWVREDYDKPIGETGFVETYVMTARFDGSGTTAVAPSPGIIQDAPVWEPVDGSTRLAWSEFNANSLGPTGPTAYGVRMYDLAIGNGRLLCESPGVTLQGRNQPFRCFGQHLAWPVPGTVVLTQDFLEIPTGQGELNTIYGDIVNQLVNFPGAPATTVYGIPGFYPAFPISASYSAGVDRLIFDGLMTSAEGDLPSLEFFVAGVDGAGLFRLDIADISADYDPSVTAGYLFSVATPQLMP